MSATDQTLRVLFLINSLGAGGAEKSLAEMLPFFREAGVDPTVAVFTKSSEGVERQVENMGIPILSLGGGPSWQTFRRLRYVVAQRQPALVHTTIFEADVLGRLATTSYPTSVLTSLVNTSYSPARLPDPNIRPWRLRAVQALDGWTARRFTAHFHAISHAVKRAAVESLRIPPSRITVIERGRDGSKLGVPSLDRRRRVRERLGIPSDGEVLLNVGRQEFQKGQSDLLRAMARIVNSRPNSILLVAGRKGNATASLERLHDELGLGNRARFLGHRDDVPDLLASSDVFIFPSLYEGLGGAVIEAMALGLPIVASDLPALREVIEEGRNGVLVSPGNPVLAAQAIESLLEDEERRAAFGARSRSIFLERFTIDRAASRMAKLLFTVGQGGGPGATSARRSPAVRWSMRAS